MPTLTQNDRYLELTTPLGKDVLLIRNLRGRDGISSLFSYEIEAIAPNETDVDFSKLIGLPVHVSVKVANDKKRFFHGIVNRLARGGRGVQFTTYRLEIVPKLWLLTRIHQSRIFQHVSVPDILKKVFTGLDVAYELQGTFEPRDYCVQYRESDFDFASRLMEEEGIFYFFKPSQEGHKMVVANARQSHAATPELKELRYDEVEGGNAEFDTIKYWEKVQTLRSSKVTLWDHCFELPHKNLESEDSIVPTVVVGKVTHKLNVGNEKLELYDYPGAYAQRFDGINSGGGEQASDLQKIYEDNKRTTGIRMEQEAVGALSIDARTDFAGMVAGHKFNLVRHFSDDGAYVVTEVNVDLSQMSSYSSGDNLGGEFDAQISFRCIPSDLTFRPPQLTPKPAIHGTQTAVVSGPAGEEIFTDKYSRVKVQFHWDREGKRDADSSCWVRVATMWAAKNFGTVFIPRIGTEVVVAFEEGDPDRPIIVGSVYNADCMPPHELPKNKTQSGFKTRSSPNAGSDNLNEIRFEDLKGKEHLFIHGEKDVEFRTKNDYKGDIGHDFNEKVVGDTKLSYDTNYDLKIGVKRTEEVGADYTLKVAGKVGMKSGGAFTIDAGSDALVKAAANVQVKAGANMKLQAGAIVEVNGGGGVSLVCGGNFITINSGGIFIKGTMVMINSGGAALSGSDVTAVAPGAPKAPDASLKPGQTAMPKLMAAGAAVAGGLAAGAAAAAAVDSANTHKPQAEENKEKTHWIEAELLDEAGVPVPNEACRITLPDGTISEGTTDEKGKFRVEGIDPGNCTITFPNLDQDAWKEK